MKSGTGRRIDGGRAGSALMASLMIVVVISGLGVVMVQLHSAVTKKHVQAIDQRRAFYVAEAGLSEAFLAVSQGKSGNVGSQSVPASFGRGLYWVDAEELDDGDVALFSTGLCGTGRFSLSAVIRPNTTPLASLGVFADSELVIESGVHVDGFDSDLGSFEAQAIGPEGEGSTGEGAQLRSNGDIIIESGGLLKQGVEATMVFGDLRPGPQGAVLMGGGASVTGSTAPSESAVTVPPITVPVLESEGELVHGAPAPLVLAGREVRYDALRVEAGAIVELQGPLTLVVGALELADGAELLVDTSAGPVCIYCTESCMLREGSLLSGRGMDPTRAALFVSAEQQADLDDPVRIRAAGAFHGSIYVPRGTLSIPASLRVFGSVAAQRVVLEAGARVSVDAALSERSAGISGLPQLICWRIVALPDTPLVSLRLDPQAQLKIQGVDPPASNLAHLEDFVSIEFFDTAGELSSYEGLATAFDWSDVGQALTTEWSMDESFEEADGGAGGGTGALGAGESHPSHPGGHSDKPHKPHHGGHLDKPHKPDHGGHLDKPHQPKKPKKPKKTSHGSDKPKPHDHPTKHATPFGHPDGDD
ncbi:MAG: hypothetical protein QGI46_11145 [Planctomycetota bacterium]|nr:hypothetical protein [Planctomycetota bacterium]